MDSKIVEAIPHVPVLLQETLSFLEPERGGLYLDVTLGAGGHSEAILRRAPEARLLALDRDPEALEIAAKRLIPFEDRLRLVKAEFSNLRAVCEEMALGPFAGILADLGVSSMQLDQGSRGFSFQKDGPLDMRMSRDEGMTARDVVNEYEEEELVRIFSEYGEERESRRIARAIVRHRREASLNTTAELRSLVAKAKKIHRPGRKIDPATQVFQALRIEVNRELEGLEEMLDEAVRLLDHDGRIVVISYHSLEDRIVKNRLRDLARGVKDPIMGGAKPGTKILELMTRRPLRPTEEELEVNPRSRSARLRAARRRE